MRNSPQLPSAHISIHALREEGDEAAASIQKDGVLFLSTPSARRATDLMKSLCLRLIYFYPRPPRGGRRLYAGACVRGAEFLSTPSVRRATASQVRPPKLLDISIHALREEGDCLIVRQRGPAQDFYPRPPRGGRPVTLGCSHIRVMISIHALREEGDMCLLNLMLNVLIFLSTPSARRATVQSALVICVI